MIDTKQPEHDDEPKTELTPLGEQFVIPGAEKDQTTKGHEQQTLW